MEKKIKHGNICQRPVGEESGRNKGREKREDRGRDRKTDRQALASSAGPTSWQIAQTGLGSLGGGGRAADK